MVWSGGSPQYRPARTGGRSQLALFLLRAKRASICGAERVRLNREAANAEVVQSKVVLSQAFSAWEPSIPILPGVQSRSKTWGWDGGQYEAIISIFYYLKKQKHQYSTAPKMWWGGGIIKL